MRLAVELLDCDFGGLCRNHTALRDLELIAAHNFDPPDDMAFIGHGTGVLGRTVTSGSGQVVNGYYAGDQPGSRFPRLCSTGIDDDVVFQGGDVEAVLFVGRSATDREFTPKRKRCSACLLNRPRPIGKPQNCLDLNSVNLYN